MINALNYKNEVAKLWGIYKEFVIRFKKQIKDVNDSLDYTEDGKIKKISALRAQINSSSQRQGAEVLNYLQEGIDYLNRKLTPNTAKQLLDTINLIKEVGELLERNEIMKLTEEFHDNPIAIKTINSFIQDITKQIPYPPIYNFIRKIEIVKKFIEQAIEVVDQPMLDSFEGWEFKCKVVEIEINALPDKL